MNLTVVAATGGVGRLLLDGAREAGHDVTAVVRNPRTLPAGVRPVVTDLAAPDPAALAAAVRGVDAVVSALGPTGRAAAGVAETGTRALVTAMTDAGVRRLVVVSAAPVPTVASPGRPHPPRAAPGDDLLGRTVLTPLVRRVLRAVYADLARMEDVLRASTLDWTAVRPPRLTDGPGTGRYRTAVDANLPRGRLISRADLAHLMLALLTRPETAGHAVGVAV